MTKPELVLKSKPKQGQATSSATEVSSICSTAGSTASRGTIYTPSSCSELTYFDEQEEELEKLNEVEEMKWAWTERRRIV
jgi:hypothetical protein